MKIPDSVKVGCQTVKVEIRDGFGKGNTDLGYAIPSLNKILISSTAYCAANDAREKIPDGCLEDTFLHELIHFASSTYGLGLDENQVIGLTGSLLQIIRDNDLDFRG